MSYLAGELLWAFRDFVIGFFTLVFQAVNVLLEGSAPGCLEKAFFTYVEDLC
jgi:hypothetical protein